MFSCEGMESISDESSMQGRDMAGEDDVSQAAESTSDDFCEALADLSAASSECSADTSYLHFRRLCYISAEIW